MSWSDRQYAQEGPLFGKPQRSATAWLIIITVAVSVLVWLLGGSVTGRGTALINDIFSFQWRNWRGLQVWRYLTYLFLHGGPSHLFWNMLLLYMMGRMLEPHLGRKRFVVVYLSLGAIAAFGFPLEALVIDANPRSVIGASGAIMGLVAVFGAKFPRAQVNMIIVTVSGAAMAAFIIGMDLLNVIAYQRATSTAVGVHFMGAAAGVVYGLFWPQFELRFRAARENRQRKVAKIEASRRQADNKEMDRILAKISEQGMGELTESERDFLRRQSERLKSRP